MAKNTYHIHTSKRVQKQIYDSLPQPCNYRLADYGLAGNLTGKGVKIAIVDSGVPDHVDINNIKESIDMSDSPRDLVDHHGHATMVSGILTCRNPRAILGIAPGAELYFAKVISPNGECSFNSLIGAVLWSIVKQVDLILLSLGSQTNYLVFHDAIKKAYEQGICVFAAAGNQDTVEYPAGYPEVLSVARLVGDKKGGKFSTSPTAGIGIVWPEMDMYTTYLHGRYTKASGTSLTAALASGLAALLIERAKEKSPVKPTPNQIYSELASLSYNYHRAK